jgi:hypothetical protein
MQNILKIIQDEDIPELDYGTSDKDPLSEEDLMEVEDLIERIEDILDRRTRKDSDDDSPRIIHDGYPIDDDAFDIPTTGSAPNPIYNIDKDETPEEKAEKERKRLNDAYERAMKVF